MPWSHRRQIRHLSAVVVRVIDEWAQAGFGLPDDGPRSQRPGHSLPGGGRALCKSNEGRPAQLLCCPILDSGLGRLARLLRLPHLGRRGADHRRRVRRHGRVRHDRGLGGR